MWKLLFSFKALGVMVLLFFFGKFFFRSKTAPVKSNEKDIEARIYRNVKRAIVEGYNQARSDEEEEQKRHQGIEDDSYI
tara:strand:- start:418 stop:654 length:237 start_codon:yes stop_codon:yes gene_type:complete